MEILTVSLKTECRMCLCFQLPMESSGSEQTKGEMERKGFLLDSFLKGIMGARRGQGLKFVGLFTLLQESLIKIRSYYSA